jgi:adenosylhomocysteine nucleosidase
MLDGPSMPPSLRYLVVAAAISGCAPGNDPRTPDARGDQIVVLVSADAEWKALLGELGQQRTESVPYGAWFTHPYRIGQQSKPVTFFHGGWGKVAAAASTQFAIDTWRPKLLVVLGTCGGLEGEMTKGEVLLARRTLIYDVIERMGNADEALAAYTVDLDTRLVPATVRARVREDLLVSADQDIAPTDVASLKSRFHAVAADWESGAIAYVASRNHTPVIVLKGVSDVVSTGGSEAYGSIETFEASTRQIMAGLLAMLPEILQGAPVRP